MDTIEKVTPLFPELVNDKFEEIVKKKYNRYAELQETVYIERASLRVKEEQLEEAKKEWDALANICNVEFKEEINTDVLKGIVEEVNLAIINPSDRRNN